MGIMNGKVSRRRLIIILALVVTLVGAMTVLSHATEIDSCHKYDESLDTYTLPGDTDFVVIKQASGNLLVWTKSSVNDTEKTQIIDAARRVAKDGAIKGNENTYWITGYQIFKAASAGISDNQWGAYGFSISSAGQLIVKVYDANGTTLNHGRISHLDYGKFKVVTGTISLKKTVVNGGGVTGTFYFKLTDSSGIQFGDLKSIVINNGSMAKNTAQWTNVPLGTYTIIETDSQGTALKDGNTTFGKELVDISNGNAVNVTLDSTAEITNTFKDIPASVQFGATKEMSGREFKAGETYEFDLYKGTDTSASPIDTVSTTADSGHSQTLQFSKLTYDTAGTYVYTVKEKNGGQTIDGVNYSDRIYKVTVTVAKNDSGRLQADYVITDNGNTVNSAVFTNTYSASGGVQLEAQKTLQHKTLKAGEFSFTATEVKDEDGTAMTGSDVWTRTASNDAAGKVLFDQITYDSEGTHYYKITENLPKDAVSGISNGVKYDQSAVIIEVKAADADHSGKFTVTKKVVSGGSGSVAQFTNTRLGKITLTKKIENGSGLNGLFYFKLLDSKGTQIGDLKTVIVQDGVAVNTVVWENLDYGEYTVIETDKDGKALAAGDTVLGRELVSISSSNNTKVTLETTENAHVDVTPDNISWNDGSGSNLFGAASNINLLAFGNVENIIDVEGSTAVKGNFTSSRGFSTGLKNKQYSADVGLMVGGNTSFGGYVTVAGHGVTGNGTFSAGGAEYRVAKDGYTAAALQALYGAGYVNDNGTYYMLGKSSPSDMRIKDADDVTSFFSNAKTYMKELQDQLASLTATGKTLYNESTVVLSGSDSDLNVFDLDASKVADKKVEVDCPSTSTVIVNVKAGSSDGAITTYNPAWGTQSLATKTIFNFTDCSKLTMTGGTAFYGSVLAPEMDLDVNGNGGNINGNAVVNDLLNSTSGFECHEYYFNGTLPGDGSVSITNTFGAGGYVDLTATKALENKEFKAGEFSFTATAVDGDGTVLTGNKAWSDTKENDASGNVSFKRIDYKTADIGDHFYKITEVVPDGAVNNVKDGITYTTKEVIVKVTVADDKHDGSLTVTRSIVKGDNTVFTNRYSAKGEVQLQANKVLQNKELTAGAFSFTATEVKDAAGTAIEPKAGESVWSNTKSNDVNGKVTFDTINYTLADVGTHYYKITEASGGTAGVTYDAKTVIVAVNVTDNGNGTLKVEKNVISGTDTTFTNIYNAVGHVDLTAHKTLTGRTMTAGEFSFTATAVDGDGTVLTGNKAWSDTKENDASGNVSFNRIEYTTADIGVHYYKVTELIPKDAVDGSRYGVKYTTATVTYKVTVKDDVKDGNLEITREIVGDSTANTAEFTNEYSAKGEAQIKVNKKLTGKNLSAGEFSFKAEAVDADGNALTGDNAWSNIKTNDSDGNVTFDPVNYTLADAGHTYKYKITEVIPAQRDSKITYAEEPVYATVTVGEDNGDGTLKTSTVTYNPNDTFTNVYDAEGSAVLHADKVLDGRTMAAGEFSFAVYPEGEDTSVAEGTNEADGTVVFSPITYKYADLGGAASKVFTYDIKESSAQTGTGITYDDTVYKAKVTVSDDGSGELKTAVKYYEADGTTELTGTEVPTFENKYDANGSVSFAAQKTLNGRDLTDNEFEFGLYNEDGTKLIESAKCSADGAVKFDALSYGLSDAGKTFTYKIKEIAGSDTTVVYDTTEYTAEVKVTDNGRGTLETAVTYTDAAGKAVDEPVFANNAKIGSIKVTKNTFNADETARAVQDTFYVALFDSTDTATAKRISDVRAINMDGAFSQTVTFEGLELGTYYVVFETDADGNIITDPASQGGIENWVGNGYENNEVTPTLDSPDGETVVNNYYDNTEYQYGSIKVSKAVKVNGKGKASSMTFYTALFSDISCTDRVTGIKALKMNGNKSTTVEFATDRNNKRLDAKAKYYVAETTKDGTAITNGKRQLGCTIGISAKTVGIDVAGIPAKSTITNSYTDKEEYYYESTKSTKTGDDSNMGIWAAMAAAAAALGSAAALFRRKNRDESSNN